VSSPSIASCPIPLLLLPYLANVLKQFQTADVRVKLFASCLSNSIQWFTRLCLSSFRGLKASVTLFLMELDRQCKLYTIELFFNGKLECKALQKLILPLWRFNRISVRLFSSLWVLIILCGVILSSFFVVYSHLCCVSVATVCTSSVHREVSIYPKCCTLG
jgi:hypothetical protein